MRWETWEQVSDLSDLESELSPDVERAASESESDRSETCPHEGGYSGGMGSLFGLHRICGKSLGVRLHRECGVLGMSVFGVTRR